MDTDAEDRLGSEENTLGIRTLARPFDPVAAEAEDRYDAVVRRVNRARARKRRLSKEMERLTQQFVDDDLRVQSGPRRGLPLSPVGRKRRLMRLVDVGTELRGVEAEEAFATADLDRMNAALDQWAKETWGG